jgi:hypothetical protein
MLGTKLTKEHNMQVTFVEAFIGLLVAYLFYRLSVTDPHHWRTFPRFADDKPNKATALIIAIILGIGIILLEGIV